jgi:NitT/TauT family transport system permease protein
VAVTTKGLLIDIAYSAGRVVTGVAIGVSLAVPVGILLAWYATLRHMFEPIVNFLRSIPPIALSPLVIVYLGIGETARVSILVWAAFFTAVVIIFESVSAIEEIYVRAARVLGASEIEIFRRILMPLLVPQLFVAIRISVGLSWATLVAAELLAAQRGLGAVIQNAGNFFNIPMIYVGIFCIGLFALIMDMCVKFAMARTVRWQERVIR